MFEAKALINKITDIEMQVIPMKDNKEDDTLNKYALVVLQFKEPHYQKKGICSVTKYEVSPATEEATWMTPTYRFFKNNAPPLNI